jgi:taurine dioxygenase
VSKLRVRRLGYALGAEITGIDFTRPIADETIAEIRALWLDHIVLSFPGHTWEPGEMVEFCSRFGKLDDGRQRPVMQHPEFPQISPIVNQPITLGEKSFYALNTQYWHTDGSYTDQPATATFLCAKILPDVGGDTLFANMYMAYDNLSPAFVRLIEGLEGVFSITGSQTFKKATPEHQAEWERLNPPMVHPIVSVHPENGRKSVYIDHLLLKKFVGMTEEESKPIADFLLAHSTRYEFTYRHRWSVNDLVIWDNRCTLHYAVPDYDHTQLRQMFRCMLLPPRSGRAYVEDNTVPTLAGSIAGG